MWYLFPHPNPGMSTITFDEKGKTKVCRLCEMKMSDTLTANQQEHPGLCAPCADLVKSSKGPLKNEPV